MQPQNVQGMKRVLFIGFLLLGWKMQASALERVIHYPSVDQNGVTIMLSGKLCVPDQQPKGIILLPHYTITANKEAPSVKLTNEAAFYKEEYVLVMPDYLGYGLSGDRVHPYLCGEITARNTVDMLLYCRPILDSMALGISLDSIYVVGYSQGGASALWTLKLLEEQYAGQIVVKKCFAGGSPVDVANTLDDVLSHNFVPAPALIPLLVYGMIEGYQMEMKPEDVLTRVMRKYYKKYIRTKDYGVMELFWLMPNHTPSYWLTKEARDRTTPKGKMLYDGLLRSSLVHFDTAGQNTDSICPNWKPKAPLMVFHSINDNLVPFQSAANLRRCFGDETNITWDFEKYGGHMHSSKIFHTKVNELLKNDN